MLIDWVTARVPLDGLSEQVRQAVALIGDRIIRFNPATGEQRWETSAWDSIRSDTHQVVVRVGSDLWMQGSPARVCGDGDAVFGSGPSAALDLVGCVDVMRRFLSCQLGVALPPADRWRVTRVDVTGNLLLPDLCTVRDALRLLRDIEGGRYRVSAQAGDTVYWSVRSKLRSGKAYAKGPHLRYLMRQRSYDGRQYTPQEIAAADRLLRLELRLGREFWARNRWQDFTAEQLRQQWLDYFGRMAGETAVTDDRDLMRRVIAAAPTEGQGKAAYGCWLLIQREGWERAREAYARRTWYRHIKILRAAGLRDGDISSGRVIPMRLRLIDAALVTSWEQLLAA